MGGMKSTRKGAFIEGTKERNRNDGSLLKTESPMFHNELFLTSQKSKNHEVQEYKGHWRIISHGTAKSSVGEVFCQKQNPFGTLPMALLGHFHRIRF